MNSEFSTTKLFDLTQSQQLIWAGQSLNPQEPIYNMVLVFDFSKAIEEQHFEQAFEVLVQQSDAMRTNFVVNNGVPKQVIHTDFTSFSLEQIDWSAESSPDAVYKEWLELRTQKVFDLSGCLFDSVLIKMASDRFIWYFNQHHLITDAWAVSVLYQKMAELYHQSIEGRLAEATIMPAYEKYIAYEQNACLGSKKAESRSFWQEKLEAIPDSLQLYGQETSNRGTRANRISIKLGEQRSAQLRELALKPEFRAWTQDLSCFNIFSTVLFAWMHRVGNQKKLSIGTPTHNRSTADFKATPGLFIELFPLLAEVKEEDTFLSLFKRVQIETFGFLRYAQPGMATPALSRSFNVVLNYIHAGFPDFNDIPTQSEWVHSEHIDPLHYLRLEVHDFDKNGHFQLDFDINNEIIPEEKQDAAIGHFLKLIDAFLTDKNQPIGQVDILNKAEKTTLFEWGNVFSPAVPIKHHLLDAFYKQVQQNPHAVAVNFEKEWVSYEELNIKSNQLAHYLSAKGAGKGVNIGLFMERSIDMIVGMMAILKTGSAYIALDPIVPDKRLMLMLEDAHHPILLSQQGLTDRLPQYTGKRICIHTENTTISTKKASDFHPNINPDDIAYVLFTSGSTGRPKGVCCTHQSVINLLDDFEKRHPLNGEIRYSWWTSIGFDVSIHEIFGSLTSGAALHIVPQNVRADRDKFLNWLDSNQINCAYLPPFLLSYMADWLEDSSHQLSLKRVLVGVEPIPEKTLITIEKQISGLKIINGYGPTEATVCATFYELKQDISEDRITPIGQPFQNIRTYLLNSHGQFVPQGVEGELHIGGMGLAKSYLNQTGLTTASFITLPICNHSRVYKTGDLCRYLPDGNIAFVGRKDNQVKVRGFRIELGEIEAALLGLCSVAQAVVLAQTDHLNHLRLVAYLILKDSCHNDEIIAFLNNRLPDYMIPTFYVRLDEWPLTINGKINKKALPVPDFKVLNTANNYTAPDNEFQQIIHQIWSEVLQLEQIGIHDNFILLGGDSLLAVQISTRMNEVFELEMPVNIIFFQPTIAALAKHIEETITLLLQELED